jgi:nickel-dependent lactate racemase
MPNIRLKYGKSHVSFDYDENRFTVLGKPEARAALSDVEIGERLDNPIRSKQLEEIVELGETVLIVVPDATRQTASASIVNLIVRRLIANGTMPFDIRIIFATGIHRLVTEAEKADDSDAVYRAARQNARPQLARFGANRQARRGGERHPD